MKINIDELKKEKMLPLCFSHYDCTALSCKRQNSEVCRICKKVHYLIEDYIVKLTIWKSRKNV